MSAAIAAYEVNAFNTATASENKIHDDAMARRFGFRGGLVPGVEVFAYMAHMPVARWGRNWLERGQAECRFLKPVYDGAVARVTATEDGDALELSVTSGQDRCATGRAFIPADGRPAPAIDALPAATPPAERPAASETSLGAGPRARHCAFDDRPRDACQLSRGHPRSRADLSHRGTGPSRADPAARQSWRWYRMSSSALGFTSAASCAITPRRTSANN